MKKVKEPIVFVEYLIFKRIAVFEKGRIFEYDYELEKIKADSICFESLKNRIKKMQIDEGNFITSFGLVGRAKRKWIDINIY